MNYWASKDNGRSKNKNNINFKDQKTIVYYFYCVLTYTTQKFVGENLVFDNVRTQKKYYILVV